MNEMKKAIQMIAMTAALMSPTELRKRKTADPAKIPLTKKQKKNRAKNKIAKKQRKINRHLYQ